MNKKIIILIAMIVIIITAALTLPIGEYLQSALLWVEANKTYAWIVFALLYIAAIVLSLPASVFSLAAGYLFGLVQGWGLVVITATIGATLAFIIGRSLLREWVVSKAEKMKNFTSLDEAVSKKGFLIVFLTRLSPVFPFSLINYVYGITKIKLRDYSIATFIGIMPGSLLYVYLGSTAKNLQNLFGEGAPESPAQTYLKIGGLIATVVITVVITRIASNALKENSDIQSDPVATE